MVSVTFRWSLLYLSAKRWPWLLSYSDHNHQMSSHLSYTPLLSEHILWTLPPIGIVYRSTDRRSHASSYLAYCIFAFSNSHLFILSHTSLLLFAWGLRHFLCFCSLSLEIWAHQSHWSIFSIKESITSLYFFLVFIFISL